MNEQQSHWAGQQIETAMKKVDATGWMFSLPDGNSAPLVFKHRDGTEVSVVDSSITNFYRVDYTKSENSDVLINFEKERYAEKDNAFDRLYSLLEKHEKKSVRN